MLETWKVRESESVVSVVRDSRVAVCWLYAGLACVEREGAGRSRAVEKIMERISETRTAWNAWRGANESYNIHVYKAYMPILQIP